MVTTHLQAQWL